MAVTVSPELYGRSFDARIAALVPEAAERVRFFRVFVCGTPSSRRTS